MSARALPTTPSTRQETRVPWRGRTSRDTVRAATRSRLSESKIEKRRRLRQRSRDRKAEHSADGNGPRQARAPLESAFRQPRAAAAKNLLRVWRGQGDEAEGAHPDVGQHITGRKERAAESNAKHRVPDEHRGRNGPGPEGHPGQ